mgnify:CR=1 FL=1
MSEVRVPEEIEALATAVVSAAFTVHRTLGPGLLESLTTNVSASNSRSPAFAFNANKRFRSTIAATSSKTPIGSISSSMSSSSAS